MKIRIKGNSIRLRLTKKEVELFSKTGEFIESTVFANKAFTYRLQAKDDIETLEADFSEDTISVYIPAEAQKNWATSNRVGYSNTNQTNEVLLSIVVEKDFVCLDDRLEDQSDNYPNPRLSK